MREILFRGKRVDNGEWETGSLVISRMGTSEEKIFIADKMTTYHTPVIPETIGQFTGLTDKNGTKIFEGDIVEYEAGGKLRIGRVFFSDFRSSFSVTAGKNGSARINNDLFNYIQNRNSVAVISNIYDTPELIGGADDENDI